MKVLLLEDVKGLGKAGEVHEVKDGYGKNFLVGKNLALVASNAVINRYNAEQRKKEQQEIMRKEKYEKIAQELSMLECIYRAKVGQNGMLQGAITKEDIASILAQQHNIDIDKKGIELSAPIKKTGVYDLEVKLYAGIKATFKLDVQGE